MLFNRNKRKQVHKTGELAVVRNQSFNDPSNPAPILYEHKEDCCGCTACYAICQKSAIQMLPDEEGFLYPSIDAEICIRCQSCIRVCPIKAADREREEWETLKFTVFGASTYQDGISLISVKTLLCSNDTTITDHESKENGKLFTAEGVIDGQKISTKFIVCDWDRKAIEVLSAESVEG